MGDVILFGVLRMPYELAMSDELSRRQFHRRASEAADIIERQRDEIGQLRSDIGDREQRHDRQIQITKDLKAEIERCHLALRKLANWNTYNDGTIPIDSAERLIRIALSAFDGETTKSNDIGEWTDFVIPYDPEQLGKDVPTKNSEPDVNVCPNCGGPADNGFDRCVPPSPYWCTKCEAQSEKDTHD